MKFLIALLLGFVQGVCEFLPVSSSGHLYLVTVLSKNAVDTELFGTFFSVMLHLATLVAVLIVYRKQVGAILRHPFRKLTLHLILATVPTVLIALLLKAFDDLDAWLENGNFVGFSFLLTACFLSLCELLSRHTARHRSIDEMRWTDALAIGGMQSIGILQGVSRSGATISGALFCGLDRKSAADFSFLLSIPAILGATCLEILKLFGDPAAFSVISAPDSIVCLLLGMAVAFITGYFAVRFMIRLITKRSLLGFAAYTGALGILVLLCQFFGWLGFGFSPIGG